MASALPPLLQWLKLWVGVNVETGESGSKHSNIDAELDFSESCDSCEYEYVLQNESHAEEKHSPCKRRRLSDKKCDAAKTIEDLSEQDAKCLKLEHENASLRSIKCNLIRENTVLDSRLREATYQYQAKELEVEQARIRCQVVESIASKHREFTREDIEARELRWSQDTERQVKVLHDQIRHLQNMLATPMVEEEEEDSNYKNPAKDSIFARYRQAQLELKEELAAKEQTIAGLVAQIKTFAAQWKEVNANHNAYQLNIRDLELKIINLKNLHGDINVLQELRNTLKLEIRSLRDTKKHHKEIQTDDVEIDAASKALLESQRPKIIEQVCRDPGMFQTVHLTARSDFKLCLAAVEQDWRNLAYCSTAMRNNTRVVRAALDQNPGAYAMSSHEYQHNHDNALELVLMNESAFQVLPLELQLSREFRQLVALNAPRALAFYDTHDDSIDDYEDIDEDSDEEEDSEEEYSEEEDCKEEDIKGRPIA